MTQTSALESVSRQTSRKVAVSLISVQHRPKRLESVLECWVYHILMSASSQVPSTPPWVHLSDRNLRCLYFAGLADRSMLPMASTRSDDIQGLRLVQHPKPHWN